jgi:hypothetical protein
MLPLPALSTIVPPQQIETCHFKPFFINYSELKPELQRGYRLNTKTSPTKVGLHQSRRCAQARFRYIQISPNPYRYPTHSCMWKKDM